MIQALLFDLDSCLCAANEVGDQLFAPAFAAIRAANKNAVDADVLERAFTDCWRFPFDAVATQHGFSSAMRAAGFAAFSQIEVRQPMHGYSDLPVLAQLPGRLFLVTSGFRRLQQSKIEALGIAPLFTNIYIDAIDKPGRRGKEQIFRSILQDYQLSSDAVLVVGDNPESEIAAGNRLGLRTVQILRPGVSAGRNATYHIRTLAELGGLLDK